jgi:hypothetical protein
MNLEYDALSVVFAEIATEMASGVGGRVPDFVTINAKATVHCFPDSSLLKSNYSKKTWSSL